MCSERVVTKNKILLSQFFPKIFRRARRICSSCPSSIQIRIERIYSCPSILERALFFKAQFLSQNQCIIMFWLINTLPSFLRLSLGIPQITSVLTYILSLTTIKLNNRLVVQMVLHL